MAIIKNNYDEVLPATDVQVARLKRVMKDRNPQDDFVIDGMSVMALIKRIAELQLKERVAESEASN